VYMRANKLSHITKNYLWRGMGSSLDVLSLRNPLPTADWSLHDGLGPEFGPRMSNLCDRNMCFV
jgi:hypothetical protein